MFKSARWRNEKNKIKTVFKLQFHATQLTQLGGDALMISMIPADVGKPTMRLEKAKVKDGSCYWEKPHVETVKFTRDLKTGKFHEKIYHFVVTTGSSKSGGLGEVSIDFASYAEATKLSTLSLPLKNANSAGVLHVSIQRVQESLDQREVDESENANHQDRSLRAQLGSGDIEESIPSNPDQETLNDNMNRDHRGSSGSDITLSSSDSSSGLDTPQEPELKITKSTQESATATIYEEHHQRSSQWDWLDDSSISPRDTLLREISEEGTPDATIKKLKDELVILTRQADVSEMELQTLRKQIVKESKKGQDLLREIVTLKEERNAFKEECEKMKESQKSEEVKVKLNNKLLIEGGDPWAILDELRQELNYEKDLNLNLRLQLQKTQESNAELILAVQDLDEMLGQKDSEKSKSKSKSNCCDVPSLQEVKSETDDDEEQKALEEIVREHNGGNEVYLLEQKVTDLYGEIELYMRDKDELETQLEQISLDFEILKQENHEMSYRLEQSQLQEQLKMQYECSSYAIVNELEAQIQLLGDELKTKSKELSNSTISIKELETHIKNLEEDLENQTRGFEADLEDLIREKIEQEQRAIRAEENVRKIRLQNANTAERLQEEFRRLSTQMASSFEANEKVVTKAMDEANQLRLEKRILEDLLHKVKQDLQFLGDSYEEKLVDFSGQIAVKSKQLEKMGKQIENLSIELQRQRTSCGAEIERLKADKQNLESQRKELENEVHLAKIESNELIGLKKDKDSEIQRLNSEMERLKSRCNDMKLSLIEEGTENEKLRKQISQLKNDLKKKEDTYGIIEKKLKDSKAAARNNRSSIEVTNLKNKLAQLEGQIQLKETALESSETLFLEKEKDLKHKIEELERSLQVSTAENSSPTILSIEDFDALSSEMVLLKKRNAAIEVELKEMQERYSEISLKFAEVEGERQQLVMTLRNIKNTKKC